MENSKFAMQSPVSVSTDIAIVKHFTPFYFSGYGEPYDAMISFTEQAISIEFLPNPIVPTVCGGGLVKEYVLATLNFHWEAEHVIDDIRYPLEGQLIHYARRYETFKNALNYKDGIFIFSVFYKELPIPNIAFENLIESIPAVEMNLLQSVPLLHPIVPIHFLPPSMNKFYRYNGSLTTHCYEETVIWTLLSQPSYISPAQIDILKKNWIDLNKYQFFNARELQEINNRNVYISAV